VITNANACLRWLARQSPDLDEARAAVERIILDGRRASEVIGACARSSRISSALDWLDINATILEVIALARSEVHGIAWLYRLNSQVTCRACWEIASNCNKSFESDRQRHRSHE